MTQLAEAADFTPIGGEYEDDTIAAALRWASSFIIGYCNRSFEFVENDVALLTPNTGSVTLPCYPVASVSSVEAYLPSNGGMAWVSLTNYAFVPDTGFLYNTTGLPGATWNLGPSWPWLPASLRVTYSHGYDVIPQGLKDVCCRLAGQYLENPSLAMNSKVGEIEDRFSGSTGVKLNDLDAAILDSYSEVTLA